jgi:hypothetical protein
MIKSVLAIIAFFSSTVLIGQSPKGCYTETMGKNPQAFDKSLYYPKYKNGDRALSIFVTDNINLTSIYNSIPDTISVLEDSVKVKFIISKKSIMSDITINTTWKILATELKKALIKSSCNWIPGGTERFLPVWYSGILYVRLEKKIDSFNLTVLSKSENN